MKKKITFQQIFLFHSALQVTCKMKKRQQDGTNVVKKKWENRNKNYPSGNKKENQRGRKKNGIHSFPSS